MSRHPSRTARHTMKIQNVETGVVFERHPPDAAAMVASGEFEYVPADTPSAAETLKCMSVQQLCEVAPDRLSRFDASQAETESFRSALLALVERGDVRL